MCIRQEQTCSALLVALGGGFDQLFQASRLEPSENQTDQRTPLQSTLKDLKQTQKYTSRATGFFCFAQ